MPIQGAAGAYPYIQAQNRESSRESLQLHLTLTHQLIWLHVIPDRRKKFGNFFGREVGDSLDPPHPLHKFSDPSKPLYVIVK